MPVIIAVALLLLNQITYFPILLGVVQKSGAALTSNVCDDAYVIGVWYYQWHPNPYQCNDIEMVPMIWGTHQIDTQAAPSMWLLGFNEPDRPDQSNLSPYQAAVLWHTLEQKYPDRLLVSPAPTYAYWLEQWRAEYIKLYGHKPRVDAVAGHVYARSLDEATSTLGDFVDIANAWDVSLWITEWAFVPCWVGGRDNALDMSDAFRALMDDEPVVRRYAWFASRYDGSEEWATGDFGRPECNTSLFTVDGNLTDFGNWYISR